MAKDISKYLKSCTKCHVNKPKVANKEMLRLTDTPNKPFQSVSIDNIVPFPTTTYQATEQSPKSSLTVAYSFLDILNVFVPIWAPNTLIRYCAM